MAALALARRRLAALPVRDRYVDAAGTGVWTGAGLVTGGGSPSDVRLGPGRRRVWRFGWLLCQRMSPPSEVGQSREECPVWRRRLYSAWTA
jgi:hypothetical protein